MYVIELSKDVLYEARFKKANPDYVTGKPCVYVGMTGLNPTRALTSTRPASRPTGSRNSSACGCCRNSMKLQPDALRRCTRHGGRTRDPLAHENLVPSIGEIDGVYRRRLILTKASAPNTRYPESRIAWRMQEIHHEKTPACYCCCVWAQSVRRFKPKLPNVKKQRDRFCTPTRRARPMSKPSRSCPPARPISTRRHYRMRRLQRTCNCYPNRKPPSIMNWM